MSSLREERRKKRIRQRNIHVMIFIGVLILCIAAVFGIVHGVKGKKESKKQEASSKSAKELEIEGQEKAKEDIPDRSDFALTPGNVPSNFTASDEKVIYLTIDDGPSGLTEQFLDVLDHYNVKATFFVTGAMPEYKNMIKEAYDRGHTIGLHTFSHDYAGVYSSVDAYFDDLNKIGEVVKEEIGYVPCFIRFPGGASNTVSAKYTQGIMTALSTEVNNKGYQYYDWNASCGDGAVKTTEQLYAQAITYNDNNMIMLMHDSQTKQSTLDALPGIIEYFQNAGYTFKAIDRESYVPHHGINN